MFNPAHLKKHTNNPLEIHTIRYCFSNRLLCIGCVDMMSIFVSYMNRGVDVPKHIGKSLLKYNDNCNMV